MALIADDYVRNFVSNKNDPLKTLHAPELHDTWDIFPKKDKPNVVR